MARLLLLCYDPPYATGWVAHQARHLEADAAIRRVACHRLLAPSPRWPRCYDWLIEIEPSGDPPGALVDRGRCADLLGDLHLSGARPIALLVG